MILVTFPGDFSLTSWGDIRRWSILGLKGLRPIKILSSLRLKLDSTSLQNQCSPTVVGRTLFLRSETKLNEIKRLVVRILCQKYTMALSLIHI